MNLIVASWVDLSGRNPYWHKERSFSASRCVNSCLWTIFCVDLFHLWCISKICYYCWRITKKLFSVLFFCWANYDVHEVSHLTVVLFVGYCSRYLPYTIWFILGVRVGFYLIIQPCTWFTTNTFFINGACLSIVSQYLELTTQSPSQGMGRPGRRFIHLPSEFPWVGIELRLSV